MAGYIDPYRRVDNNNNAHAGGGGGANNNGVNINGAHDEPYNFISLPQSIIVRYESFEDLPKHDCYDPNLFTGEITATGTCKSPFFVGGKDGNEFITNAEGKKIIPGSTLRGLIRSNLEILSQSYLKFVEDRRFAHRGQYEGAKGYKDEMDNSNVKGGWIVNNGGQYVIYESQYKHDCYKGSDSGSDNERQCPESNGDNANQVKSSSDSGSDNERQCPGSGKGKNPSVSDCTIVSKGIPAKNHTFKFDQFNMGANQLVIPPTVIADFEYDFKKRENLLRENKKFYRLPDNGKKRPIFYRVNDDGSVKDIGSVRRYRAFYNKSVRQCGLSELITNCNGIDYANAMFGFLDGDKKEWGFPKIEKSYKSRVSFSDAVIEEQGNLNRVSAVLGGPSPKWVGGYLEQLGEGSKMETWNSNDAKIRGSKQYWGRQNTASNTGNGNANVASNFTPVDKGSTFTVKIRFENLHADELSLLVNSIKLQEDMLNLAGVDANVSQYQLIGKAKPLGYGKVEFSDPKVSLTSYKNDFASKLGVESGNEPSAASEFDKDAFSEHIRNQGYDTNRLKQYIKMHTVLNDFKYLATDPPNGNNPNYAAYKRTVLRGI